MKINVPDSEICRQAIPALRGYAYQLYRSLEAWLSLNELQSLLLEVAEDFAVLTEKVVQATQVKDTVRSRSVTLKTQAIKAAIDSLWKYQAANPNKDVRLMFLTTSTIGKERGVKFPGGKPGLRYWREAARHGAEVRVLSSFLTSLQLSEDLLQFLHTATNSEIQERLLRRIQWECGSPALDQVEKQLEDRLVYLGQDTQRFEPSDAIRVRDALFAHLLRAIVGDVHRELTKADLLAVVEEATSIRLSFSQLRQGAISLVGQIGSVSDTLIAAPSPLLLKAADIPGPSPATERKELIN